MHGHQFEHIDAITTTSLFTATKLSITTINTTTSRPYLVHAISNTKKQKLQTLHRREMPETYKPPKRPRVWNGRPHGLVCYLCGREYGSSSLYIHIPRCAKLWKERERWKQPRDRRPLPPPPSSIFRITGVGGAVLHSTRERVCLCLSVFVRVRAALYTHNTALSLLCYAILSSTQPMSVADMRDYNAQASQTFDSHGQHHCPHCATVLPDDAAVTKHMRGCQHRPGAQTAATEMRRRQERFRHEELSVSSARFLSSPCCGYSN
jgi:hypothetical protein